GESLHRVRRGHRGHREEKPKRREIAHFADSVRNDSGWLAVKRKEIALMESKPKSTDRSACATRASETQERLKGRPHKKRRGRRSGDRRSRETQETSLKAGLYKIRRRCISQRRRR